jgi:methylmalonic acid semialdehyde dehydrogenase
MTGFTCDNVINGQVVAPVDGKYMDVTSPSDGKVIGRVAVSTAADVNAAVQAGNAAFVGWSALTTKARCAIIHRFYELVRDNSDELARLITMEHGKNHFEALGDVNKGNETVEYACGMAALSQGQICEVSRGITCHDKLVPVGVVASIVPFNFPFMVPMWTSPIALALGNCVILKPSEKVPATMWRTMELIKQAGFPDGVVQVVNGCADAVNALVDSPGVNGVTFVGSSKISNIVKQRASALNKRVLALGGAKNHLVAAEDCNIDMTANDVVNSFTGCTGQRCMAASVLLTIGPQPELIAAILEKASRLSPGNTEARHVGPVIDKFSLDKITGYLERTPGTLLLDGRSWTTDRPEGYWIGPTVIKHTNAQDPGMCDEIFGPVLSVYECKDRDEAIAIENGNPYGNAACIYTNTGAVAQWYTSRFSAGMLGVNVGVPVPREPFSFGGINMSSFSDTDITGQSCVNFMTKRIKVTTKWVPPTNVSAADWMS